MNYRPGLHIIAEFSVADPSLLTGFESAKACIDGLINQHGLQSLGDVYHNFQPAGFTAVVCLSESHISLHSWPEFNRLHLDIYLSNFMRDNDSVTQSIYDDLLRFFDASVIAVQTLKR